ncbi:MAG: WYL domain-containing protein [Lachnospiraceae bacterium]|nr:WYL domain-containing protein [Lachnospiraceae bacterium]
MKDEDRLNNGQINELIKRIQGGDNDAWKELIRQYEDYIHSRAWSRINGLDISNSGALEEELFAAGWIGFISALRNHDTGRGNFTTYATYYIDGEMSKQLDFEFNSTGITNRQKGSKITRVYAPAGDEKEAAAFEAMLSRVFAKNADPGISIFAPKDLGDYTAERRALQILDVLKLMTDEEHSLSCEQLQELLSLYRKARYGNDTSIEASNTFNKSMGEILLELNPEKHTDENDGEYRIKYDDYASDYLNKKVKMKKDNPNKVELAPVINGLRYVHDFDNESLDRLIQLISFSDMFSNEEKSQLIARLSKTASVYYRSPFVDGDSLKFNPSAIHGRFAARNGADRKQLCENLKTVQKAINNLAQITFRFNRYTADHRLVPKYERVSVLSPYHMVVYHDNYYVIGLNQAWGDKRVLHYRVDLMSDIEIAKDDEGKIIPVEVTAFAGLPICNAYWDPEKYMAEHINMAFDEPRLIKIKIEENGYTRIHDWFGDHYKKIYSITETDDSGNKINHDIVELKTSPYMIVHWAMQYGTAVEIMDEEIREEIRKKLREMQGLYDSNVM